MIEGNYIVIQSFMVDELHLKGNELLIYAIIYGFSQDGEQSFTGGVNYIAEWLSTSRQCVFSNLKSLVEKGYIVKQENFINGVKFVNYQSKKLTGGGKDFLQGVVKKVDPKYKEININSLIDKWNGLADVAKIEKLTDSRLKSVSNRINEHGYDKVIEAIEKIENSRFLRGENDRGWCITFDWFIKPSNFVKVLEGNYDDKAKKGKLKREPSFDIEELSRRAKMNEVYDV